MARKTKKFNPARKSNRLVEVQPSKEEFKTQCLELLAQCEEFMNYTAVASDADFPHLEKRMMFLKDELQKGIIYDSTVRSLKMLLSELGITALRGRYSVSQNSKRAKAPKPHPSIYSVYFG